MLYGQHLFSQFPLFNKMIPEEVPDQFFRREFLQILRFYPILRYWLGQEVLKSLSGQNLQDFDSSEVAERSIRNRQYIVVVQKSVFVETCIVKTCRIVFLTRIGQKGIALFTVTLFIRITVYLVMDMMRFRAESAKLPEIGSLLRSKTLYCKRERSTVQRAIGVV